VKFVAKLRQKPFSIALFFWFKYEGLVAKWCATCPESRSEPFCFR
jgi:hypothetical protein